MIKASEIGLEIKGSRSTVLTDLSCIINGLVKSGISKDDIEFAVNLGFKKDEEIDNDLTKIVEDLFEKITGIKADLVRKEGK